MTTEAATVWMDKELFKALRHASKTTGQKQGQIMFQALTEWAHQQCEKLRGTAELIENQGQQKEMLPMINQFLAAYKPFDKLWHDLQEEIGDYQSQDTGPKDNQDLYEAIDHD